MPSRFPALPVPIELRSIWVDRVAANTAVAANASIEAIVNIRWLAFTLFFPDLELT